ncbi:MAG: ABC transporter ATP-binding protein [Limnochordia bacterium]
MSSTLLNIENGTKQFRSGGLFLGKKINAVDGVSFALGAGSPSILSIVGESGSGKTTLARMILKLIRPTSGDIRLLGKDIWSYESSSRAKEFERLVQPIFQNPFEAFSPYKPVERYLYQTALNIGGARTKDEARDIIVEVLSSVGLTLEKVQGKHSHQFSGGELQRIAIARALISRPKLLVADEPVAMIDASSKMNVINLFRELKETNGVSIIYITHDLSTAYYLSDFIANMFRGNIVEYGPAQLVLNQPQHPYTQELLDAVPKIGQRWDFENEHGGNRHFETRVEGCNFFPRCPRRTAICETVKPPDVNMPDGRRVQCHLAEEDKAKQERIQAKKKFM